MSPVWKGGVESGVGMEAVCEVTAETGAGGGESGSRTRDGVWTPKPIPFAVVSWEDRTPMYRSSTLFRV